MNPILAVKLALVPVAVFGIAAGLGHVTLGATAGALLALGAVLWRRRRGAVPALEWTILATLADDVKTRNAKDYLDRKSAIGDEMIAIAERALPGLASRIVCRTEASPLTFRRDDWSSFGAIYCTKGDAVETKSPIPGIVFAGAATHGAGIEAVAISGALAAEALIPGLLDTPDRQA